MQHASKIAVRFLLLTLAGLAVLAIDVSTAFAQSASCRQLDATLQTLERNRAYQSTLDGAQGARSLQRQVQRNESAYIRNGCNDDAKAGRQLTRECRALAREITTGREEVANLSRTLDTGNAVAQQREAILQEMARFNCNGGSRSRVIDENGQVVSGRGGRERGNLFDQLFDSLADSFDGEGGLRGDEFDGYGSYHTVRTLCVRKSDGFYWPISYSTLTDYLHNDLEACKAQCPTLDVDLYYYDNPGQEPEQMINTFGEPYTALPNAFRFRTEFDKSATCKQTTAYGTISVVGGDGSSRAMISYNGVDFPLPVRDPRGQQPQVTTVALDNSMYVSVPLPRRRPAAPGETPKPVPVTPTTASSEPQRVVQFGNKRVRIVGPETPYAPSVATGT